MSPDTLATVALIAIVFLATWGICRDSTEGALPRYLEGRHYHRAGKGRHVRRDAPVRALPAAAVEEPASSPWAPPNALATIPDALNTARTA